MAKFICLFLSMAPVCGQLRGMSQYKITYFNNADEDNKDRLKDLIKENKYIAVSFVDEENCSHCDQWKSEYRKIAHRLKADRGIYFVEVKGNRHPLLMKTYGVLDLPTLKFFGDNWMETYEGKYLEQEVSYWLEEGAKTAVTMCESTADFGSIRKRPRIVLSCDTMKESFRNVAKREKRVSDWYFLLDQTKKDANCTVSIQHRKEQIIKMVNVGDWEGNSEEIQDFFNANKIPIVGHVDMFSFDKYLEEEQKPGGKKLVWFLFKEDVDDVTESPVEGLTPNQLMHQVAENPKISDKFTFLYATANEDQELIDSILFAEDETIFPTIKDHLPTLVVMGTDGKYILYDDAVLRKPQIEKFLYKVHKKEIVPKVRSEAVPSVNDGPVKIIVGTTMKETFFQGDSDVVFLVYAPWCGHCTIMNKEFEKVADFVHNKLRIGKKDIKFTKMDGDANESTVPDLDYDAFPTVFYIKKGSYTPLKFEGENLAINIWNWIKKINSGSLKDNFDKLGKSLQKFEEEL